MNKYKKIMLKDYIELAQNLLSEEIEENIGEYEYSNKTLETIDEIINKLTDIENIIGNEI